VCPVDPGTTVEVRFRAGSEGKGKAAMWLWRNDGTFCDIVAYRVVGKAADKMQAAAAMLDAQPVPAEGCMFWDGEKMHGTNPTPVADTITETLTERGKRYGVFTKHAEVTQEIKRALFNCRARHSLAPDQVEALEMIAHKLGRIVNGDPDYADSWVDIAGYAKLVADRLQGVAR
jgi:hypothetical protein